MTRYSTTMSEILEAIRLKAGFSPEKIKMAIGIASDPRYKKGNMSGAVAQINKLASGLSDHPQVAAVLRRQNEETELDESGMTAAQKAKFDVLYKQMDDGPEHKALRQKIMNPIKANDAFHALVKRKAMGEEVESVTEMTADEKRLINMMYDKKGNLTDIGKKVMDHGKKNKFPHNTSATQGAMMTGKGTIYKEVFDPEEADMAAGQLEFIKYAAEEIKEFISKNDMEEWFQNKLAKVHGEVQSLHAYIEGEEGKMGQNEQVEIDEAKLSQQQRDRLDDLIFNVMITGNIEYDGKDNPTRHLKTIEKEFGAKVAKQVEDGMDIKNWGRDNRSSGMDSLALRKKSRISASGKMNKQDAVALGKRIMQDKSFGGLTKKVKLPEDTQIEEAKSSSGYDLYHKDFSTAMSHAYDFAKKKYGITVNPTEIDDKVASGPRKPSVGNTNSYRLKGDRGAIQVQVYNTGKSYELNMYKESVDLDEAVSVDDIIKQADKMVKSGKSDDMPNALLKVLNGMPNVSFEQRKKLRVDALNKIKNMNSSYKKESVDLEEKPLTPKEIAHALAVAKAKPKDQVSLKKAPWESKEEVEEASAPKIGVDNIARIRAQDKDNKHSKQKPMNSTQKSLASIRGRSEEVTEEGEPQMSPVAKAVAQDKDLKKKTRIAQLQLQIAKSQQMINQLNDKPGEQK